MKEFENIKDVNFKFTSCEICDGRCCDGRRGSVFTQILLSDFKEVYEYFPIAFIMGNLGYIKPVILLSNGKDFCRYLKDFKCTIYEKRPSICRVYPLSPSIDNDIYVDTTCPAVEKISQNIGVANEFQHDILQDYQKKFIETFRHISNYAKAENLKVLTTIDKMVFLSFKEDFGDKYLSMHLSSVKNFNKDEYYQK